MSSAGELVQLTLAVRGAARVLGDSESSALAQVTELLPIVSWTTSAREVLQVFLPNKDQHGKTLPRADLSPSLSSFAVIMTLDPDTAQSWLILSADHRSVTQGTTQQSRPDNPERFDPWPCVLGCGEFSSGRLCWEVEVCCGSRWAVGVALQSVKRKGLIDVSPAGGIWAVGRYKEKFQALTSPAPTPILPNTDPRRVRVCLDHAEGQVMFVNVDSGALIFTFLRATFAGQRIRPWFWVGRGSRLKLCPRTQGGPSCIPIWPVLGDSHC